MQLLSCGNPQAQELGEAAVDPQVRLVPERIRAHPSHADQRLVPARVEPAVRDLDIVSHLGSFRCSSFPCPRLPGPAPSRALAIFIASPSKRRSRTAIGRTRRLTTRLGGGERRGGDAARRPGRRRADDWIVRHGLSGELGLMLRTPGSRPLKAHPAGSALRGERVGIPWKEASPRRRQRRSPWTTNEHLHRRSHRDCSRALSVTPMASPLVPTWPRNGSCRRRRHKLTQWTTPGTQPS